ncbi:hypothetical protein MCHI_000228 [Candidatus Magnetoovum chiemensis]|nr:hypothetical protein MCHI_000228 [Candidatus Magnetoovum chiemensis]
MVRKDSGKNQTHQQILGRLILVRPLALVYLMLLFSVDIVQDQDYL